MPKMNEVGKKWSFDPWNSKNSNREVEVATGD